jgi:hypothetical protein
VEGGDLAEDVTVDVYWANGTGYENQLGAAIFSYTVRAGTAAGQYGPIHIDGDLLDGDLPGTTHLIAVSGTRQVAALVDVSVAFGSNANAAVVSDSTIDIIKDGLRAAGQTSATINSTARTPADQARAMFNNLVKASKPVADNVADQLRLYAPPGDAVVNVFVAETQGMTRAQIIQNRAVIQTAMVQEINTQGCTRVTNHCADPAQLNVVDVGANVFNSRNSPLFIAAVQGRVSRFLDERNSNGCFHLEV